MTIVWVSDMSAVIIRSSTRHIVLSVGYDDFIPFIVKTSSQARLFYCCHNIPNN